jgi:hypothetical protein
MSSSVPEFSQEAQKYLGQASEALVSESLTGSVSDSRVTLAQANATIGLGYAVLAVFQYLPNLEPK